MEANQRSWDLSVPTVRDVEAPLGGTSTVYEIVLIQGEDQFLYTKTFREIEDFCKKLYKKFPNENFPTLPSSSDVELKRKAAEAFLKFVAENPAIVSSSLTQQFIGQDKSIKQIVKDRNIKPPLPASTIDNDLFEDPQKNSRFSPFKESNLFDDDSCDLFSNEPAQNSRKIEAKVTEQLPNDKIDGNVDQKPSESEGEDDDHLFMPRKGTLIQCDELVRDTDDIFRVEDNLPDLFQAVAARRSFSSNGSPSATSKTLQDVDSTTSQRVNSLFSDSVPVAAVSVPEIQKKLVKPQHLFSSDSKTTERKYSPPAKNIPQFQLESEVETISQMKMIPPAKPARREPKSVPDFIPESHTSKENLREDKLDSVPVLDVEPSPELISQVKPVLSAKPALPAKPTLPAKPAPPPKPITKPKPVVLEQKPETPKVNSDSEINPVDIGRYIAAAEMDNQREISLFDD